MFQCHHDIIVCSTSYLAKPYLQPKKDFTLDHTARCSLESYEILIWASAYWFPKRDFATNSTPSSVVLK